MTNNRILDVASWLVSYGHADDLGRIRKVLADVEAKESIQGALRVLKVAEAMADAQLAYFSWECLGRAYPGRLHGGEIPSKERPKPWSA